MRKTILNLFMQMDLVIFGKAQLKIKQIKPSQHKKPVTCVTG